MREDAGKFSSEKGKASPNDFLKNYKEPDWRLPTANELQLIAELGKLGVASLIWNVSKTDQDLQFQFYWSSTEDEDFYHNPNYWFVRNKYGFNSYPTFMEGYIRLVKDTKK